MTEAQFLALRSAVNLARERQVRRLSTLRQLLLNEGFSEGDIRAAFMHWADYEKTKRARAELSPRAP